MSDYYPKSERNIWFNNCVDWKNEGVAITYNQISINGTRDKLLAIWTKGEPLPVKIKHYEPSEAKVTVAGVSFDACDDYIEFDSVQIHEITHTFSAELPDGCIVEMPAPGGDWEQVEHEEFKRGNIRLSSYAFRGLSLNSKYGPWYIEVEEHQKGERTLSLTDLVACRCCEQYADNNGIKPTLPILSITTWRREVAPEPPEEEPYDYHCPSKQPLAGRWPERDSEVE
jgi:hypothetical protein